jgi:chitinase
MASPLAAFAFVVTVSFAIASLMLITPERVEARVRVEPASPRVVGYLAAWNDEYSAESIPGALVTDVMYSFARVKDGGIALSKPDPKAAPDAPHPSAQHFAKLAALKMKYPQLRTLISVGGWGASEGFSEAAADEPSRRKFGESCAAFILAHGFDGVDIDWEFPGDKNPADAKNFTLLLAAIRKELDAQAKIDGRPYFLTIAASAGPAHYTILELGEIQKSIDWFNLMGYDLNGGWSQKTDFNAPLFAPTAMNDFAPNSALSIDNAVKAYLAAGVPREKIVVGVSFYGQVWSDVGPANDGLFQPHGKVKPRPLKGDEWTFRTIREQGYDVGPRRHWNDVAKVPWFYDPATKVMVSYEDPASMKAKGDYARENGLGGVMIWELSQDDDAGSLLRSLVGGLRGELR